MTTIPVNPAVLIWARSERGLDTVAAAERLRMSPEELNALESGEVSPDLTTLRRMAKKYQFGLSALLMPEPLPAATRLSVLDFRTHKGGEPRFSPELRLVLDQVNDLIEGLADLQVAAPKAFRPIGLRATTGKDDPVVVAAEERERMRLTVEAQLGLATDAEAFNRFRSLLESQGVFVYVIRAGITDDWRGLAIYDERQVPVILINGDEPSPAWRLFTLFHEYYHLLLRQNAISDETLSSGDEALCNRFAAHFLMPREIFLAEAREWNPSHLGWTEHHVRKLGERFHLSLTAVAIHIEDLGMAPRGYFDDMRRYWRSSRHKKSQSGDYYLNQAIKYGSRHFDVVFHALDTGILDQLEAYELTEVDPENFKRMRATIEERRAAYGWTA